MTSGIYSITHTASEKQYIGSSFYIEKRWRQHKLELNSSTHHSKYLQRAWDKYGKEGFQFIILEECSQEVLIQREQYYLDRYSPAYNICKIAGSCLGIKQSKKMREKLSRSLKGKQPPLETCLKAWEANRGKSLSEETKKKISDKLKGHAISENTKLKLLEGAKKARQEGKYKGHKRSEETKRKISEAQKGKKSPNLGKFKVVIDRTELEYYIYETQLPITKIAQYYKVSDTNIKNMCKRYSISYHNRKRRNSLTNPDNLTNICL